MIVRQLPPLRFGPLRTFSLGLLGLVLTFFISTPAHVQAQTSASAATAYAQQTAVIALLPFDGKETTNPPRKPLSVMPTANALSEALMVRPQSVRYRVLPPDLFGGIARIKYHGKAPDLRAMARLLKANLLLGGFLEATPGPESPKPYRLTLTLYDAEGQVVGQLGYDLEAPTINTQRFLTQATAFFQLLDGTLHIPGATPAGLQEQQPVAAAPQPPPAAPAPSSYTPPPAVPQTLPPPSSTYVASTPHPSAQKGDRGQPRAVLQADDHEEAPLGPMAQSLVPKTKEASYLYDRRPPWQSAFDVRAGYLYNTRSLVNENSPLSFPRSGASGLLLNFELHPLAFFKQVSSPLAGLGMRLTAMLPFWGSILSVSQQGGSSVGSYQAAERRVEFALRWHWNFWNDVLRPDIEVEGLFGDHAFEFSQPMNLPYLALPSADYRYLGALAGLRLYFTRWLSARAALSFAKHLSLGALTTVGVDGAGMNQVNVNGFQSYGPGSGWLWRADLGASAEIWHGITAGLGFYYEANSLSFDGQGNIFKTDGTAVTRVRDDYLGFMLHVGYYFRSAL